MSLQDLSKPISRASEKAEKKKDAKRVQRAVYAFVTIRDMRRCRACSREANPSSLDMTRRGAHHHIRFRSAGGQDTSTNLCLLCNACHSDVHAHRLTVTGNADSTLVCSSKGRTWDSPVP